jgi:uncharacterized delta-60 repeat protein
MRMRVFFIVGAVAVAVPVAIAASGGKGGVDPTFGTKGRVDVKVGDLSEANAVLAQPDGKVVLAGFAADRLANPDAASNGDFLAIRLNRDGSPDKSFGAAGIVRTRIDPGDGKPSSAHAVALALGPDGSIVLAGQIYRSGTDYPLAFARLTPTGTLDTSFSGDGILTLEMGPNVSVNGVAVQPDGKIVAVGESGSGFLVLRLLPNGALDESFGSGGIVSTSVGDPAYRDAAAAVAVLGDGKIVVAGTADFNYLSYTPTVTDFALVRYLPDGKTDPTFGSSGIVVTPGPMAEGASGLAVAPDGKIIVAGSAGFPSAGPRYPGSAGFHLARYLPSGALDATFGESGTVTTWFEGTKAYAQSLAYAQSVAVEPDGRILVAGTAFPPPPADAKFAVAAYEDNGTLDKTFGDGGKRTYGTSYEGDYGSGAAIQRAAARSGADRLVLAGYASYDSSDEHVLAIGVDLGSPPPARCHVPRVIGLTLSRARARIGSSHCTVGHVRKAKSISRRGTVISQSPRAGRYLSSRGRVSLVVSLGR